MMKSSTCCYSRKLLPPAVLKLHPLAVLRVSSSHLRVSGLQRYLLAKQGRTLPLCKGRLLPWVPESQGPPKMLFIYEIRINRGHANGCLLPTGVYNRQPSALKKKICWIYSIELWILVPHIQFEFTVSYTFMWFHYNTFVLIRCIFKKLCAHSLFMLS